LITKVQQLFSHDRALENDYLLARKPNPARQMGHSCIGSSAAKASPDVFTIDKDQSHVTFSAKLVGLALDEQSPGNLTTILLGTVNAELSVSGGDYVFTTDKSDSREFFRVAQ
jgi:hypothetical protein